jgi:hypothetical protein
MNRRFHIWGAIKTFFLFFLMKFPILLPAPTTTNALLQKLRTQCCSKCKTTLST